MGAANSSAMNAIWPGLEPPPEMDDSHFGDWTALLKERTGMNLPKERKSFLITSLNLRMREIGYKDYKSYYDYLQSGKAGKIEWAALVDRLTVHETRFFRDQLAIDFFRDQCLPDLFSRGKESIDIWSAGCSTGEEPYTLAMEADEFFAEQGRGYYGITATDISMLSLAVGKKGVYSDRKIKGVAPLLIGKYLNVLEDGQYQVVEELRNRVCFAHMNILDAEKSMIGDMDIIFCQNLLIYFDQEKRAEILEGMVSHLKPFGVLILGPGEVINWHDSRVERVTTTNVLAFRRLEE